ncbi:MAG: hypothetical protein RQ824_01215 [bacterium]|nr:hypothetical protein [bacterium]
MLLRLTAISLTLDEDESFLSQKCALRLAVPLEQILSCRIVRKSLDARKKSSIHYVYTLDVDVAGGALIDFESAGGSGHIRRIEKVSAMSFPRLKSKLRPVVVGAGPAGLFAALRMTEYGLAPLILERGRPLAERVKDVDSFWKERRLDPESNVQFGEGGAGTFSDGKLTTRVDDPRIDYILQALVDAGADEEIKYLAKPHIGTDRLRSVIVSLRRLLIERGCEIRFSTKLSGVETGGGALGSLVINDEEEMRADRLVLAIGHSARDTYGMLESAGVEMQAKPFAIGLRVEHPQRLVDKIQYGPSCGHDRLPPSEYVLKHTMKEMGRSVYSFCMCPGGMVVNASSEPGRLVVNGMSLSKRDSLYANSALVVTVRPEDFAPGEPGGPLGGIAFQRRWEEAAFRAGGGNYSAPAQNLAAFMEGGKGYDLNKSSFLPSIEPVDLKGCLPSFVTDALMEALPVFGRKMKGFVSREATLIGVETRTSAPVRIMRGENFQSVSTMGVYPCGEGAGYAGGIVSSALDGIKVADAIAQELA